jgi:hypothetical protein
LDFFFHVRLAENLPLVSINGTGSQIFPEIHINGDDTGRKFATGAIDAGGKLPPVSMTLVENCHRCHRRRRQIATGIIDAGGKLPPVSMTPATNYHPCHRCRQQVTSKGVLGCTLNYAYLR